MQEIQNDKGFRKRKGIFQFGGAAAVLFSLCLFIGCGAGGISFDEPAEKEIVENEETVLFGEGQEWEHWQDYLFSIGGDAPYVYAFMQTGEESADFVWGASDERDIFVDTFLEKKDREERIESEGRIESEERTGSEVGTENGEELLSWYFVKFYMEEDVHGTDIYEYLKQNLSEEGWQYKMCSLDGGRLYAIWQLSEEILSEDSTIRVKRDAVIQDGYLYLLFCKDARKENLERVNEALITFEGNLNHGMYRTGTEMDEEALYWSDHTQRIVHYENPERTFIQERAFDLNYGEADRLMGYFPLMREAEYQIQLSPDLPKMRITFRWFIEAIPESGYETYLYNGLNTEEPYRMEIWNAEDGSLIQRTDIEVSIHTIDTIAFEDMDEDGYLEMKIIHPAYDWADADMSYRDFWTWNNEIEKLVRVDKEVLLARQEENRQKALSAEDEGTEADAEEIPQTNLSVIPVTVEKGGCLWKLAEEYYGDGSLWVRIYEYNYEAIGENPSFIYEGTELWLPWGRDWN